MNRILVIEDEPLQLELIVDRLTLEFEDNAQIDTAPNMQVANSLCEKNRYDVVVTDLLIKNYNSKEEILDLSNRLRDSYIVVYTVEPDAFPLNNVDNKRTFIVDKMKSYDEGMGGLLNIINRALVSKKLSYKN